MKTYRVKNTNSCADHLIPNLVAQAKEQIEAELTQDLPNLPEHLLHLSLNEAEAIAWNTGYPHLIFPILAEEKATVLLHWHIRQEFLRAGAAVNLIA